MMNSDLIREKFIEMYGVDKYKKFVLSLYEAFPLRENFFFWQEEMLSNFSKHYGLENIDYAKTYLSFNRCPIHNVELEKDTVQIVDGNAYGFEFAKINRLYPFANIIAPRNLEMFDYPKYVEVYFCQTCREKLKDFNPISN